MSNNEKKKKTWLLFLQLCGGPHDWNQWRSDEIDFKSCHGGVVVAMVVPRRMKWTVLTAAGQLHSGESVFCPLWSINKGISPKGLCVRQTSPLYALRSGMQRERLPLSLALSHTHAHAHTHLCKHGCWHNSNNVPFEMATYRVFSLYIIPKSFFP